MSSRFLFYNICRLFGKNRPDERVCKLVSSNNNDTIQLYSFFSVCCLFIEGYEYTGNNTIFTIPSNLAPKNNARFTGFTNQPYYTTIITVSNTVIINRAITGQSLSLSISESKYVYCTCVWVT